jgi:molecular chaperone DnaK
MKEEAEANAETDKKAKEEIDKMNNADALIFQTEKQLKEYGDKIPDEKKAPIEAALNKLKEAHKNKDLAAIESSMNELNTMWQAASQEMYQATQQPGGDPAAGQQSEQGQPGGNGGGASSKDDTVTDVDFEEVKDDK